MNEYSGNWKGWFMNRKVAVHRVNTEAVYFVGSGPDLVALAVEAKGKKRKII